MILNLWEAYTLNEDGMAKSTSKLFATEALAKAYSGEPAWWKGVAPYSLTYYASLDELQQDERAQALAKLTPRDRELLGL